MQFLRARERLFCKICMIKSGIRNGVQIPNQSNVRRVHICARPKVFTSAHIHTHIQRKTKLSLCPETHTKSNYEMVRLLMIRGFHLTGIELQPFSFADVKAEADLYLLSMQVSNRAFPESL